MLILWYASFLICVTTLGIGVIKQSSCLLLISTITSLPIAYYFLGAVNAWRYIGFMPIILVILTIYFGLLRRRVNGNKP